MSKRQLEKYSIDDQEKTKISLEDFDNIPMNLWQLEALFYIKILN